MCDYTNCAGETLCWRCKRPGTGSCSWDKNLTPVPGWDAVAVRWRDTPGKYQMTWHINACPLFDPEPDYGRRMHDASASANGKAPGRPPKADWTTPKMGTFFRYGWSDRVLPTTSGSPCAPPPATGRSGRRSGRKRKPPATKTRKDEPA